MKRLILFSLLLLILSVAKSQSFTGAFGFKKDAQDLLQSVPDTLSQSAAYYVLKTYGTNEQRFYQWFLGVPGGGSNGMNPDSLSYNLANHYIIVPSVVQSQSKTGYWSTPKLKNTVANIPDFYTKLQDYLKQQGISNTSARITADSLRLINETSRSITAEATKEPVITPGTVSQYWRGDKAWMDFITAVRAGLSAGVGVAFVNGVITNTAPNQIVSIASGGGISVTGTYPSFTVSQLTPTYNNAPARALNTSFRPSATRPVRVSYTVSILTTLSLLNLNSSGKVDLQISPDGTTWSTINSAGITRTLSVSITVGLNDTSLFNVQGEIPAGYYCRLFPTVAGGATVTFASGQEVGY